MLGAEHACVRGRPASRSPWRPTSRCRSATLVGIVDAVDSPTSASASTRATASRRSSTRATRSSSPRRTSRNVHVKDFAFSRQDGWVGFTFAGAPLGDGLLDYDYLVETVRPDERGINQIIEHWLPWQGDSATTVNTEDQWTLHNLRLSKEQASMTDSTRPNGQLTIAVIGAGGKMGMRVSNNLQRSTHAVYLQRELPGRAAAHHATPAVRSPTPRPRSPTPTW